MKGVINKTTEIQLEMIYALYGAIGDYVDIACVADDLGTQRSAHNVSLDSGGNSLDLTLQES